MIVAETTWQFDQISPESMRVWVDALRDDNAIHVDPVAANALGFGMRTVNPGPANLAYMLNMLIDEESLDYPIAFSARFTGNVFSGDSVEVAGSRKVDGTIRAILRVPGRDEIIAELLTERVEPRR